MIPDPSICERLRASWGDLDAAEPSPGWAVEHLRSCATCRSRLASDPSRLFAVLRGVLPEPVPAWTPLTHEALEQRRQAQKALRRSRAWALAAAAVVVLAAALWVLRPQPFAPGGTEAGPVVAEAVSGGGFLEEANVIHAVAAPTIESIASPAARVVEFKIFGQEDQVTKVILIFDEGIEL
ncbi:MAG: hypothetical protein O7F16_10650 [Acidobacteria bacterium]|nr:hypothetical protein [Acidobacteriota bacterium]